MRKRLLGKLVSGQLTLKKTITMFSSKTHDHLKHHLRKFILRLENSTTALYKAPFVLAKTNFTRTMGELPPWLEKLPSHGFNCFLLCRASCQPQRHSRSCRWVPLFPNTDNPNSRLIRKNTEIISYLLCYTSRLIQNCLNWSFFHSLGQSPLPTKKSGSVSLALAFTSNRFSFIFLKKNNKKKKKHHTHNIARTTNPRRARKFECFSFDVAWV